MASEGSRKRRARNVPARMAEYISDFVVEETPSKIPSSSSSNDHSHSNTPHILPLPPHSSAKPAPTSPLIPEEKDNCNHDLCDNCGDGGDLICCDRCPASFHLLCVEPPLHNNTVPEGDWFCKQCTTLINPPKLPKNPIAASLLRQLSNMNPRIFTLPKEIFEVAKKGKGFSEEGRQMGSGTTATDVFGNSILLGTCSVCTVEGKQESLIACSACKTLYHTYCVDPVLVNKPAGFWICPNHDADSLPLPPGVSRVLKGHNTTHLLPSGSVRLDFVPSPYSEYGSSDDSGSDDSDDDDSSGSGDGSDSSDNEGGHSAPFRAMVRSIRKAAASGGNNSRRDNRRRGSFDSYTYLDDFYDDEVYEEIDLFTPPEDQTRLLLNLGRPQRLRFNNNSNDNALLGQNKQQLDSLLAQQRLLAQAAMPATDLFGNPLPTPTSPASILSNSIPSTPQTSNTASSTTATTDENNESEKTSSPMDTSTDTSSTPATTTSTDTTNSGTPNTTTTPQVPMDSIFGTGLGCSPLALAQLTPLFTQFLAWQRLMQVNQQIQQHQAGNAVYLQQQQQQQPQLSTEQQVQQIQQQRAQLRNYYESFQNQQPYRPPSLYNQHSSDYMDIDAGAHLTHRFSRSHLRPGPPTVPSQPRVPLRAKSPHAKPFPQSRWVRDKSSVRPPSARPPPPSLKLAASSTPHTPSQPSSVQTTPSAVQFSNHPSIYSKPTTPYQTTPKSSPFTTPTPNTQTSPTSSDAGTPTDPPSGSIKSKYVRKRKPAVESPPSPKKTPREGSDGDKDDDGDGKESADKKSKRDNAIKLRGKGGRFVHKDPVLAAQAAAQAAMTAIVKAKKGSGPKKDKDGEKEKEAKEQESTKEDILKSPKIEATKGDKAKGEAESPNKVKDVEMKTEEQSEGKEDKKDTNQDFDTFVCLDINMEDTKATATVEANGEVERTEEERKKAEEEKKKVEEKAPKRSQRQIEKGEKKKLQEADKESDQEEEKKPKRREKKKKEDAEEEVTGKKRKLSRTKKPETRKKKKETLEEEIQPPPRTSDTVFEGKVENSANNTNNNDNKSTITITTNKPNNNVSLNNNTTTTTTTAAKPITPNKPTTTTPSTTPTTTTTAATTTKTTTPISKPPTITTTPVTTPTTTPISKPPTPIPATPATPATPVNHTTNITNTNNTTPTNTTTNVRHVSSYFSNATTYTPNSTNSTSTPTTNNDNNNNNNNNNSITREGSSTTLATSTSSSSSSKPMIVIEEARMKSLDTIQEKVKYNKPILGKLVVTVVDPFVEEENLPKPITYEIRKPVVSIGRTRINKIPGEPDIIDVDTSDFGANARPVSHLHAYLVFCPSSYDPTLPGEVSLWILGRNYTKVDGVQHKGGIVALTNNSVFKVSKVKFEFTQLI